MSQVVLHHPCPSCDASIDMRNIVSPQQAGDGFAVHCHRCGEVFAPPSQSPSTLEPVAGSRAGAGSPPTPELKPVVEEAVSSAEALRLLLRQGHDYACARKQVLSLQRLESGAPAADLPVDAYCTCSLSQRPPLPAPPPSPIHARAGQGWALSPFWALVKWADEYGTTRELAAYVTDRGRWLVLDVPARWYGDEVPTLHWPAHRRLVPTARVTSLLPIDPDQVDEINDRPLAWRPEADVPDVLPELCGTEPGPTHPVHSAGKFHQAIEETRQELSQAEWLQHVRESFGAPFVDFEVGPDSLGADLLRSLAQPAPRPVLVPGDPAAELRPADGTEYVMPLGDGDPC